MVSLDAQSYYATEQYVELFGYAKNFSMRYVLQEWEKNKDIWWYDILGRNLDVKIADVCCDGPAADFIDAWEHTALNEFCEEFGSYNEYYSTNLDTVFNCGSCFNNIVTANCYVRAIDPQTKKRYIEEVPTTGMRFFKAFRLVVERLRKTTTEAFSKVRDLVDETVLSNERLEDMRNEISRLLQDKKIKDGELHISINPIDFMSASDNLHNWTSCMSWVNLGCYRTGTIEMMNSPYVACAYVCRQGDVMHIGADAITCSNKIWRAWVYLLDGKEVRMVGVNYPYFNKDWTNMVLDWLKKNVPSSSPLNRMALNDWGDQDEVTIVMEYMYNDFDDSCKRDDIICDIPENYSGTTYFDISAPVRCFTCGRGRHLDEETEECEDHGAYEDIPNKSVACTSCIDFQNPYAKPSILINGIRFTANDVHNLKMRDLNFNVFTDAYSAEYPYCTSGDYMKGVLLIPKASVAEFMGQMKVDKENGIPKLVTFTDPECYAYKDSGEEKTFFWCNEIQYLCTARLVRIYYRSPYDSRGQLNYFYLGIKEDFFQDTKDKRKVALDRIKHEVKFISLY